MDDVGFPVTFEILREIAQNKVYDGLLQSIGKPAFWKILSLARDNTLTLFTITSAWKARTVGQYLKNPYSLQLTAEGSTTPTPAKFRHMAIEAACETTSSAQVERIEDIMYFA